MKKLLTFISLLFFTLSAYSQSQTAYPDLATACDQNSPNSGVMTTNRKIWYSSFAVNQVAYLDTAKKSNKKFDGRITASRIGFSAKHKSAFVTNSKGQFTTILGCVQTLTASPGTLTGFSTSASTPSGVQSIALNGSWLPNNIVITAPMGFEVSFSASSNFATSITSAVFGYARNLSLFVRMASSTTTGIISGNVVISNQNGGATIRTIAVTGTVGTTTPALTITPGSLTAFSSASGSSSTPQTLSITGSNLTAQLYVSISTGSPFVASETDVDGNYANSFAVNTSSGSLSAKTLYVKMRGTGTPQPTDMIITTSDGAIFRVYHLSGSISSGGSAMRTVPATVYTPTNNFGEIGFGKFADFTAPTGRTFIWNLPGRNQLLALNKDVFDRGMTHVTTFVPNISTIPYNKRVLEIGINGIPSQFSSYKNWLQGGSAFNSGVVFSSGGTNNTIQGYANDFYCQGCAADLGNSSNPSCCDLSAYDIIMTDIENNPQGATDELARDIRASLSYWLKSATTKGGHSPRMTTWYGSPFENNGVRYNGYSNYSGGNFPYDANINPSSDALAKGFPTALVGHNMKEYIDLSVAPVYPSTEAKFGTGTYIMGQNPDGSFITRTFNANTNHVNVITSFLEKIELLRVKYPDWIQANGTIKYVGSYWMWNERFQETPMYRYVQNGNDYEVSLAGASDSYTATAQRLAAGVTDLGMPDDIAKAMIILTQYSGSQGIWFWDYSPCDLQVNQHILPLSNGSIRSEFVNLSGYTNATQNAYQRKYRPVEAVFAAMQQLWTNHTDGVGTYNLKTKFFEANVNYLCQDTEVDYGDGSGYHKYTALEIENNNLPFVRAIVNPTTNEITWAAYKPYVDVNFSKTMTLKYGSFTQSFTLTGNQPMIFFEAM